MAGLTIAIQADLQKFEDGMRALGDLADRSIAAVEDRFRSLNADISPILDAAAPGASAAGKKFGGIVGGGIVAGIVAAGAAVGYAIYQMIGRLSALGDKADALRLPVNLLQALGVAAAEARVKSEDLNKALDKFTEVSKSTFDDGNKAAKALDRKSVV